MTPSILLAALRARASYAIDRACVTLMTKKTFAESSGAWQGQILNRRPALREVKIDLQSHPVVDMDKATPEVKMTIHAIATVRCL
ncbi:hypothetical protein CVT26_012854 [Gymnopilus dilepis]|uniref:Uncharacterized protein n=1 Tax=Gymnopilus dilepis TaxID=231916 RepID=A0A409WDQ6_9AGAR|nr:hypothetical protein CVT26_012854 [Gymnopilus dilepis]